MCTISPPPLKIYCFVHLLIRFEDRLLGQILGIVKCQQKYMKFKKITLFKYVICFNYHIINDSAENSGVLI